jgi:hypothetical protein
MRSYRALWLCWAVAFVVIELTAAFTTPEAAGTLSVTVWDSWFPTWWSRALLLVFWATVGVHFANRGRRWFSGGAAVALTGLPVALAIAWRERAMLGKIGRGLKKAGGWLFKSKAWALSRGPLIGAAVLAAGSLWPPLKPFAEAIATSVAGPVGVDPQTTGVLVDAVVKVIAAIVALGVVRKQVAAASKPATPGK